MKRQVPSFVMQVAGTASGYKNRVNMDNWLTIHAVIKKLKPSRQALWEVSNMLVLEYNRKSGPRMDIIARLYGKFNAMRKEIERAEL